MFRLRPAQGRARQLASQGDIWAASWEGDRGHERRKQGYLSRLISPIVSPDMTAANACRGRVGALRFYYLGLWETKKQRAVDKTFDPRIAPKTAISTTLCSRNQKQKYRENSTNHQAQAKCTINPKTGGSERNVRTLRACRDKYAIIMHLHPRGPPDMIHTSPGAALEELHPHSDEFRINS